MRRSVRHLGFIMQDETEEVMLAQEQGVRSRKSGEIKELEGALGGELDGTLVLTNRRLIFICSDERMDRVFMRLVYSDVEDLASIPTADDNLFIDLSSITSAKGHRGHIERPSLEVRWRAGVEEKGRVFVERLTGRSRRRNLNDWAPVIERLKAGTQELISLPKAPGADTLEGRILLILADMQKKGTFEIEEEAEERFKLRLDSDAVESACEKLASSGLIEKIPDPSGDLYFQRRSPLGEDAL